LNRFQGLETNFCELYGAEEQNMRTFSPESADEIVNEETVARNNARKTQEKAMFYGKFIRKLVSMKLLPRFKRPT
jgi:hypothetical protein